MAGSSRNLYRAPARPGNVETALIALGANLPFNEQSPAQTVRRAMAALGRFGVVRACSGLWSSPAWPDPQDPRYVNAAARLETAVPPEVLMPELLALESAFGRQRSLANAPRTLDLDLIDHGGRVREETPALLLPHPRAHERAFVLLPLRDVAPRWRHPKLGTGLQALFETLGTDALAEVERLEPGPDHAG